MRQRRSWPGSDDRIERHVRATLFSDEPLHVEHHVALAGAGLEQRQREFENPIRDRACRLYVGKLFGVLDKPQVIDEATRWNESRAGRQFLAVRLEEVEGEMLGFEA